MRAYIEIVIFGQIEKAEKIIEKTTFDVSHDVLNYFKNLLSLCVVSGEGNRKK